MTEMMPSDRANDDYCRGIMFSDRVWRLQMAIGD